MDRYQREPSGGVDAYSSPLKGGRKFEIRVLGGKLRKADIESIKGWLDWTASQLDEDEAEPADFVINN